MSSAPPGLIIATGLFFFGAVVSIELDLGGVRSRFVPDYDRFRERLPGSVRLIWVLMQLSLGIMFVLEQVSPGAPGAFLESPPGYILGTLFWVGLVVVFVNGFTRKNK